MRMRLEIDDRRLLCDLEKYLEIQQRLTRRKFTQSEKKTITLNLLKSTIKKKLHRNDYYQRRKDKAHRILASQNSKCFYCKKVIEEGLFTLDHKVPQSKGGTNRIDNLVASCTNCNAEKGNLSVFEYKVVLLVRRLKKVFHR